MNKEIMIGNHKISEDSPTFVIAEMKDLVWNLHLQVV